MPGRADAVLLGGEVLPKVLWVRLYWDAGLGLSVAEGAATRHKMYAALLAPGGGELTVPGDSAMTYRDALCTSVDSWLSLFEDGSAEVGFTCFDPVAYGVRSEAESSSFTVGGTWATWPAVTLVARAGPVVKVADGATGKFVLVGRAFAGGEAVALDFARETCTIEGVDASGLVSLGSDFFSIGLGAVSLTFTGCSSHSVSRFEGWA